jgi:ABC-2 type transport system permease protein
MFKSLKKYFTIYTQIMKMMIGLVFTYRLNVFTQGIFTVVYMLGLLFLIEAIFLRTPSLGGWSKDEIILMYGTFTFMWGWIALLFFDGFRRFCVSGVRAGELDAFLTKPANTEFLVGFSFPDISIVPHQLFAFTVMTHQIMTLHLYANFINFALFFFFFVIAFFTLYFIFGIYASSTFYLTNSAQLLRMAENLSDHSQYPTTIYPQMLQPILYSILPTALLGYVPASFLLGRGSWQLAAGMIALLVISIHLNHFFWERGLRNYSSASS